METSHPSRAGRRATAGPWSGARRFGHVVGILVNLLLLYLVNVRPGWSVLPFLTADTTAVLGLVNASLWVSVVAEAVYVVQDRGRVRALGDLATTAVGLAALARIWAVFPVDLSPGWVVVARVFLVVGIVGSVIGVASALRRLVGSVGATAGER